MRSANISCAIPPSLRSTTATSASTLERASGISSRAISQETCCASLGEGSSAIATMLRAASQESSSSGSGGCLSLADASAVTCKIATSANPSCLIAPSRAAGGASSQQHNAVKFRAWDSTASERAYCDQLPESCFYKPLARFSQRHRGRPPCSHTRLSRHHKSLAVLNKSDEPSLA